MKTLTLVFLMGFTQIAEARCMASQVCDDYGRNCRVMDICDNNLDLPSINLPPLRPLPSMELKPLPSMETPFSTSRCRYQQVDGRWKNICNGSFWMTNHPE